MRPLILFALLAFGLGLALVRPPSVEGESPLDDVPGLPATLQPLRSLELRAPRDGVLAALEVQLGQQVAHGQPLFRLDDTVERARVALHLARSARQAERELAWAEVTRLEEALNAPDRTQQVPRPIEVPGRPAQVAAHAAGIRRVGRSGARGDQPDGPG